MTLPFNIESIEVKNTGFGDDDVEGVVWINKSRIQITNEVMCVFDSDGGTTSSYCDEFEWSFEERDNSHDAYVLITLKNN